MISLVPGCGYRRSAARLGRQAVGAAAFALSGFILIQSGYSQAVRNPSANDAVTHPAASHQFEIGPELFHYYYEEPGLMEMDGWLVGLDARFTWISPRLRQIQAPSSDAHTKEQVLLRQQNLIIHLHGRYAVGETDYDGALLDEFMTPYQVSGIDTTTYEVRALAGYAPFVTEHSYTAFYLGFGYRFKDDDSSFDPAGYKRESTYRYIPIAIEHHRQMANGQAWSLFVEYDHLTSGEQVSTLPDLPGIRKQQRSGYGLRAAIAWHGTARHFEWRLEPFIRYWDIADSDSVFLRTREGLVEVLEPANTTLEIGLGTRIVF